MNSLGKLIEALRGSLSRLGQTPPEIRLRVVNLTRNTVLAASVEVADTAAKRNKGLLGRDSLAPGEGLWIRPCESVHTFWMRFPIDLVYLDRKKSIRKLVRGVPAWRVSACLRAHSVLELPQGTIHGTETQLGDTLEFSDAILPGVATGSKKKDN